MNAHLPLSGRTFPDVVKGHSVTRSIDRQTLSVSLDATSGRQSARQRTAELLRRSIEFLLLNFAKSI